MFYFYNDNNNYVLLHTFRKKTKKTPRCEIEQAKSEREDYLSQKGGLQS
ncbi:MAG: type II toxin-antitoxin system RelE/ParE family toxin [Lachnospiraceae bacterium]|nr:type II toxin-antitoxin system RelE/ParE family toxin [Lachnospiraceae bacterium]